MKFEEKLRKEMLLKGFNQQKLARLSGVSDSEVSRILSGKSQPGLENALKIARAVDVSLDYLTDDTLTEDPRRAAPKGSAWDAEILELAGEVGHRDSVQLLLACRVLGFEVAIRRLLGAEMRPIIEVDKGEGNSQALPSSPPGKINSA